MTKIHMNKRTAAVDAPMGLAGANRRGLVADALGVFRRNPVVAFGSALVMTQVVAAVLAPWITVHGPLEQFRGSELEAPSVTHWFGTDQLGRDIFARVVYGARVALRVGIIAVGVGALTGGLTGAVAGYFGRAADTIIMRAWDAVFALPAIILAIAFAAVFGASGTVAAITIGIASMPVFARISRAAVLGERHQEYVEAARMGGATHGRILFLHVLPNAVGPILVQLAVSMGTAILVEAGLSFLGLGVQPPTPAWGSMLNESLLYARQAPWYGFFPGLALTLLILGLNTTADGLRDVMDPRSGP